ncbi:MBL fold metallo-hydrolase [Kangiella shandongensis]|uniref:MBL fold metallo-hydrolase n=1 Tax=Kangiella shandongensis TaxID=2763258 RepID=UPI001CBE2527|nr:MBL fold metallo-hydrolase [Kangiella shandongensis]
MLFSNTFQAALFILLTTTATLVQAEDGKLIPYAKVDDNFYVLLSDVDGSNVGVNVAENGLIIVDTMLPKAGDKLTATIRDISDKPVKFVINTHDHMDHTGNNKYFLELGATALTQDNITNNKQLKVVTSTAASHSTNDLLVYFPDNNVLMMGDTFTNNWYPTFWTGGLKGQINVINKALELSDEDTVVVPGHGFITDSNGLKQYRDNNIEWVNRIMELHAKGLNIETIVQDKELHSILEKFANDARPVADLERVMQRFVEKTIKIELKLAQK